MKIISPNPDTASDLHQYIKNFKSVDEFRETSWQNIENNSYPEYMAEKLIALLAYIDLSSKLSSSEYGQQPVARQSALEAQL